MILTWPETVTKIVEERRNLPPPAHLRIVHTPVFLIFKRFENLKRTPRGPGLREPLASQESGVGMFAGVSVFSLSD